MFRNTDQFRIIHRIVIRLEKSINRFRHLSCIFVFWCDQERKLSFPKGDEGFKLVILELSHRSRAESKEGKIRINCAYTRRVLNRIRLEYKPEIFATRGRALEQRRITIEVAADGHVEIEIPVHESAMWPRARKRSCLGLKK